MATFQATCCCLFQHPASAKTATLNMHPAWGWCCWRWRLTCLSMTLCGRVAALRWGRRLRGLQSARMCGWGEGMGDLPLVHGSCIALHAREDGVHCMHCVALRAWQLHRAACMHAALCCVHGGRMARRAWRPQSNKCMEAAWRCVHGDCRAMRAWRPHGDACMGAAWRGVHGSRTAACGHGSPPPRAVHHAAVCPHRHELRHATPCVPTTMCSVPCGHASPAGAAALNPQAMPNQFKTIHCALRWC
eukprot:116796-Chlamydomonas_euryale.AAC.3